MPASSSRSLPGTWAWGLVALVTGLVLVSYWPAMHGAVLWDDPAHLTRPGLRGWDGLWRIWTEVGATQQYYPVLFTAFWIEHRLWGDAMFGYHLANALLHAANACLLGAVVWRLWSGDRREGVDTGAARCATGAAALVFAVHPVCVESVAWVTEQKNTLSTLLYLVAGLLWLRHRESGSRLAYAAATVCFVLGLGAKSVVATLPAALLVVVWWQRGRIDWRREVVPLLPWFLLAIVAGLHTAWVEKHLIGADGAAFELTLGQRVLLAARVAWFYAAKVVWPADFSFFYPRWDVASSAAAWSAWLAAGCVLVAGLWMLRRRTRGPLATVLLYVGTLFPALGFFDVFPFQFSYVADHFQYLALVPACAALGGGIAWGAARVSGLPRRGLLVGVATLLAVGVVQARARSGLFVSNELIFRHNVARVPDSWMAHHILAHSLAKDPARSAEAVVHFREALRHHPDYPDSHLGLAVELAKSPATRAEAVTLYERAIALRPHYAEAHNNLGLLLAGLPGREVDAERHLREAARLNATFVAPRYNLANLLARSPARRAEAIAAFEEVVRLDPGHAQAHHSLGVLLIQTPDRREASLGHFEAAVRLDPTDVDALNSLAIACAQLGRLDRAGECWRRALELDPKFEPARENLRRLEQMRAR